MGLRQHIQHSWLLNEKELFYMEHDAAVTEMETEQSLQLFEEEIYRPENAHAGKQR